MAGEELVGAVTWAYGWLVTLEPILIGALGFGWLTKQVARFVGPFLGVSVKKEA